MKKLMKKAAIMATVATMTTMAISVPASAYWYVSGTPMDQYEVKDHQQYVIETDNLFNSTVRNVFVLDVYEKDGTIFGTNRTIKWIDTDTGENGESTLGRWGYTHVYDAATPVIWIDNTYSPSCPM